MQVTGDFIWRATPMTFLQKLQSPQLRHAAAMGLNEHAAEQRRQSITSVASYTGVPKGRMASKTRLIKASVNAQHMTAVIRTADIAIPLAEYGNAVWTRDLNPFADGVRGGSVSSMKGAEATGWNVRRQFKGAFIAKGKVLIRTTKERTPLKVLSMAILANELSKPSRPNVAAAERYAALDLEKRVIRHVIRTLGV